ncbi:MAG: DUF167 family protein YggU [Plesiomonas shigelloides]
MPAIRYEDEDLLLALYIQPKSSRDALAGLHGDELKLAITAPPVDGKANAHICKLLAKQFKVAKGEVIIERGQLGRHKLVRIRQPRQIPDDFKQFI